MAESNTAPNSFAEVAWPSDQEFDAVHQSRAQLHEDPVKKWRDLPHACFRIIGKQELTTSLGPAAILSLESIQGEIVKVWAPQRLVKELEVSPAAQFICNNGLKESSRNPNRQYYSFDLL